MDSLGYEVTIHEAWKNMKISQTTLRDQATNQFISYSIRIGDIPWINKPVDGIYYNTMTDYFAYNNQLPIPYINRLAVEGWQYDALDRPYLGWKLGSSGTAGLVAYMKTDWGTLFNFMPSRSADELAHIVDELIEFGAGIDKWVKEGVQLSAHWYRALFNFYQHAFDFGNMAKEELSLVKKFISKFGIYDDLVEWMKYWMA